MNIMEIPVNQLTVNDIFIYDEKLYYYSHEILDNEEAEYQIGKINDVVARKIGQFEENGLKYKIKYTLSLISANTLVRLVR